ncbi:MAG: STAS domain-containing protein [Ignavibacteriales bacterium]|jgi:anti-anti-sigma factor|nr:STAS domain-containing protein [Ignavibacteriaceae bacterium]NLH62233.1 STAS domain-containing protein [Ignavibacteriales bacterium]HOJ17865.1 STAS domain-containing protein [Ignavibacteriaceae bacterium]HPO54988.1 STAS domain-containing protein [Ignavibacteriaceae bacterium]
MDFKIEKINDISLVCVNLTRATLSQSEKFKAFLSEQISPQSSRFVVDLSECEFVDSSFLGALVVNLKKTTALGGDIKLFGLQSAVNSMFELTRMNKAFEIFKTKNDAVNAFK